MNDAIKLLDLPNRVIQVLEVAEAHVAQVGDPAALVWIDAGDVMDVPHHRRLIADLAGAMTRSGPVRDAEIERNADQANVEAVEAVRQRSPHEGGDFGMPKGLVRTVALPGDRRGPRIEIRHRCSPVGR